MTAPLACTIMPRVTRAQGRSSHSRQRLSDVRPVLVGGRFAVEFREPGWFKPEVYDVLQRWDLCLCAIHVAMPR